MATTTYITSPLAGIDITATSTGTSTVGAGAKWRLGTLVDGTEGTQWMYVQASSAITKYDVVIVDQNGQAQSITTTLATAASGNAGNSIAFAQVAFAQYAFGWVALRGSNLKASGLAAATADSLLYTTATAGRLGTASTGNVLISGVVFTTAVATANMYGNIIASNPLGRMVVSLTS